MKLYLDVIWALNFGIDAFLLLLTGYLLKRIASLWRIAIAALIGSTIVLFYFTSFSPFFTHPITKLCYSIVMVSIAFGWKKFSYFLQSLCMFYFVTFAIGGGLIGAHYFLQSNISLTDGTIMTLSTGFGDPISWTLLLFGFPILYYFSKKQMDGLQVKKLTYEQIVAVTVKIEDRLFQLRGLIDSGNHLQDPITKMPVMIVQKSSIEQQLPEAMAQLIEDVMRLDATFYENEWAQRIRFIPFRGVGNEHDFLCAVKPDEITIRYKDETITMQKALVGITTTVLSSTDEYNCILHPKMLIDQKVRTA